MPSISPPRPKPFETRLCKPKVAPMVFLPAEIYAIIFAEVEPSALAVLCRTCRHFLDQAQHILFHTIDLEGHGMRATKSWCLAVTRHPHLAQRVAALSLQLPEVAKLDPADGTKIHRALMLCVNLKELKVTFEEILGGNHRSAGGWFINECPFRLTKFNNLYFEQDWIAPFWRAQSELRVLSAPYCGPLTFSDEQLPNLVAVKVCDVQYLPAGRPLQRIEAPFPSSLDHYYSGLAQYSHSLTTLNLLRESADTSIWHAVILIARVLPALVNFGITEVKRSERRSIAQSAPANIFQNFCRLETFVLLLINVTRFRDPDSRRIYAMGHEGHLKDFGAAIMEACPTLRQTVLGSEVQLDRQLTCTLRRDLHGAICSETGTTFDFDAMSKFWNP
ncbi:hypothetical protein B0H16DRAFT_1529060 [Mycena metata]|uniref:F-box domain-containing protein n=1 Tax=Mycena metata TaxID=1033252 RepID=A0AAD7JFB7_9AGAR|nr:hypothetical protein B0H16DRAFT_1529060 [Mycena metata]